VFCRSLRLGVLRCFSESVYILLSNIPSMSYTRELGRNRIILSLLDDVLTDHVFVYHQPAMYQLKSHLDWRSGLAVLFCARYQFRTMISKSPYMSKVRLIKIARIKANNCQWRERSDVGVVQALVLLQAPSLSAIDADSSSSSSFDSTSTSRFPAR
jgi:hypothetical protein